MVGRYVAAPDRGRATLEPVLRRLGPHAAIQASAVGSVTPPPMRPVAGRKLSAPR